MLTKMAQKYVENKPKKVSFDEAIDIVRDEADAKYFDWISDVAI